MKTTNTLMTALAIVALGMLTTSAAEAQTCDGTGIRFLDLNGDGFNDNAPDHDGDGIPNGLDPDYVKSAQDGTGYQHGKTVATQAGEKAQTRVMSKSEQFARLQAANGYIFRYRLGSLGDVAGDGEGMCNGTGGGMNGTGVCDGSGPKGEKRGGK